MMKGLFKRKATIEAEAKAAQALETAEIGISDDFMQSVIGTEGRLTSDDRKMSRQYRDQLNALSFIVHTLNGQKGITAAVPVVTEMGDGRTGALLNISAGHAKIKKKLVLVWLDGDAIMVNNNILSKKGATNFMNPVERKGWMRDLAQELAKLDKGERIHDRHKGYFYECLSQRQGQPVEQSPYFTRKPGRLET